MINIRPVSDLRNKFPEVEETVINSNTPVFLTKNGYGTMVLMSIKQYSALTDNIERKLDEADAFAANTSTRLSKNDVFDSASSNLIKQHENTPTTGLAYATFLFFTLSSTTLWKCADFYIQNEILTYYWNNYS